MNGMNAGNQAMAIGGGPSREVTLLERPCDTASSCLSMPGVRTRLKGIPPKEELPVLSPMFNMSRKPRQSGFSLIELMVVVAIGLIILGFAIPNYITARRNYRIAGDARNMKSDLLLAKMRAAARFTRTRVRFNTVARSFQTEVWNKGTDVWDLVVVGAPTILSDGVNYGFGTMTDPPVNPEDGSATQAILAMPPICKVGAADDPGGGGNVANTTCIVFNSRGYPVDDDGILNGERAIYVTDGNAVEGATLSVTGIARIWRGDASDATYWIKR